MLGSKAIFSINLGQLAQKNETMSDFCLGNGANVTSFLVTVQPARICLADHACMNLPDRRRAEGAPDHEQSACVSKL